MRKILSKTLWLFVALLSSATVLSAAPLNRNAARDLALEFLRGGAKTSQIQVGELVCVYPANFSNDTKGGSFSPLYAFNFGSAENNSANHIEGFGSAENNAANHIEGFGSAENNSANRNSANNNSPANSANHLQGFVIIAGESDFSPVIGYSLQHAFPTADDLPANLLDYLQWHELRIEAYQRAGAAGATGAARPSPSASISAKKARADAAAIVAPLLENHPDGSILYNQRWPYNLMCPNPDSLSYNVVTGCVATALAQIARYYEYPEHGEGTVSYSWGGETLTADLSQSYYDWDNMLTDYNHPGEVEYSSEQLSAVALLHKDIGYAVKMMYGYNGSGAYDINAMTGMVNHLNYSKAVRYEPSANYDEEGWRNLLISELDKGEPLYHSGYGTEGGHAFVCDGYNEDAYFHFNWGWAGFGNGWYLADRLEPTDLGTGAGNGIFNDGRLVLVNMRPPKEGDESTVGLTYTMGSNSKALNCKRGIHSASDTLNCTAYDFYNYTADTCFAEMAIAYWRDGEVVAVEEFDYEGAWDEGWDPGNGEHNLYEGPGEYLPPFYGYNRMDFEIAPGKVLGEGTYKMALAGRYNRSGSWKEVRGPVALLSSYKLVIRHDSVLVFLPDEEGDIPEPEYPDVIHVRYKVIGNTAVVAWDVDSSMRVLPLKFRIYADGKYKGLIAKTEYTMQNLEAGEHELRIVAIYGYTGEDADGVSVKFTVEETSNEKVEALGAGLCRVWPNPVSSVLNIETREAGLLRLLSPDGKTLLETHIGAGSQRISVQDFPAGAFILRFESRSGRVAVGKMIRR